MLHHCSTKEGLTWRDGLCLPLPATTKGSHSKDLKLGSPPPATSRGADARSRFVRQDHFSANDPHSPEVGRRTHRGSVRSGGDYLPDSCVLEKIAEFHLHRLVSSARDLRPSLVVATNPPTLGASAVDASIQLIKGASTPILPYFLSFPASRASPALKKTLTDTSPPTPPGRTGARGNSRFWYSAITPREKAPDGSKSSCLSYSQDHDST